MVVVVILTKIEWIALGDACLWLEYSVAVWCTSVGAQPGQLNGLDAARARGRASRVESSRVAESGSDDVMLACNRKIFAQR